MQPLNSKSSDRVTLLTAKIQKFLKTRDLFGYWSAFRNNNPQISILLKAGMRRFSMHDLLANRKQPRVAAWREPVQRRFFSEQFNRCQDAFEKEVLIS
jgi:hypothetical protein